MLTGDEVNKSSTQNAFMSRHNNKSGKSQDFKENIIAMALRIDKLYKMQSRLEPPEKCLLNVCIKKWHERFGHQNVVYVRNILKRNGINYQDDWDDYVCPGRTYGKQQSITSSKY
ncbi:hypothetical protein WA026_012790 [Henosepilachna vigintioctopunctata]|uniref:GAG-pre-integrase domain-containing protein n=1 Tax=Henosepilachna vigintioctopunctata TaxID=420089 RepID=A0AAW1U632_9CUCU